MESSPLSPRHLVEYRTRFDEASADGWLRSSGYLRWAQDMAWVHSEQAGLNRAWYRQRGLTWLIRAVQLDVLEEVEYGSSIAVTTEVIGFRRVWARRRTTFVRPGDRGTRATAMTDWVLLNDRGSPVRIPDEISQRFVGGPGTFSPMRVELPATPRSASWREFAVRSSEVDPLRHVNNAAYLDYLEEHLSDTGQVEATRQLPRRYQLEFLQSAEPGMELVGRAWQDEGGWSYRLGDTSGRELLRARLQGDSADFVGG